MGLMYTLSVWTTRKVLDVYEHAWKAEKKGWQNSEGVRFGCWLRRHI